MRRFARWLRLVKKASPYRNVFLQVFDIVLHRIRLNIGLLTYYKYEFYKGQKTWKEKSRYISTAGSLYYPYELNRLKYNTTLTNKYVQKSLLMGFGLPTPRLIATIGPHFEIKTLEEFQKFLFGCHQSIVVKPVSSRGGHNVLVLECQDKSFRMAGELYTAERMWQHMKPDMKKGILIEEKMSNNRQLAAIYPNSLNCFRVTTIKLDNQWKVLIPPYVKLGHGGSVVDYNLRKGGILLYLDEEGNSQMAYSELQEQQITQHPDTGAPLVGIRLEGVDEVKALGLRASQKFGFMGTIGWDIGLTEKGPVIIEGNNLWGGLQDQNLFGGFVTDEMTRHLKKHTFLSRWDRKRMFPRFHHKMKAFKK
jgi:hypothetical protein